MGDLSGITVVAVEQAVAAPFASSRLAAAGARVIKVERADGDFARAYDSCVKGQSAYFVWLNHGKESLVLNLAGNDDQRLLRAIIAKADILIQNLKPGVMERFGLGSAKLRAAQPELITCDITGFGSAGPQQRLKAYDLIVQGEAGLCAITGNAGPARSGISIADIAAGATAFGAILQALFAREHGGVGRRIEVSLFDSLCDWMNVPFLQYLHGGAVPARVGVAHPTIAPYGAFRCTGGEQIILAVQNDAEWRRFCTTFLGDPGLADEPRFRNNPKRVAHRVDLDAIVAKAVALLSVAEALARLESCDIACGRLNELSEAAGHPHLRSVQVETPAGDVRIIAPAPIFDGAAAALGPVPALGSHTDALRAEFDINPSTEAEILC